MCACARVREMLYLVITVAHHDDQVVNLGTRLHDCAAARSKYVVPLLHVTEVADRDLGRREYRGAVWRTRIHRSMNNLSSAVLIDVRTSKTRADVIVGGPDSRKLHAFADRLTKRGFRTYVTNDEENDLVNEESAGGRHLVMSLTFSDALIGQPRAVHICEAVISELQSSSSSSWSLPSCSLV